MGSRELRWRDEKDWAYCAVDGLLQEGKKKTRNRNEKAAKKSWFYDLPVSFNTQSGIESK